jgi:hypothetical protein
MKYLCMNRKRHDIQSKEFGDLIWTANSLLKGQQYIKFCYYIERCILLMWFKTYIYNRKQRVELKFPGTCSYSSLYKTAKSDVPQGLLLEPLPFNSDINDNVCQWHICIYFPIIAMRNSTEFSVMFHVPASASFRSTPHYR